jgi:hypothetical protein
MKAQLQSRAARTTPGRRPGKRQAGLDRKIERLASNPNEFRGNIRRPAGFLSALLELVELMGPELSASPPGTRSTAAPRRA